MDLRTCAAPDIVRFGRSGTEEIVMARSGHACLDRWEDEHAQDLVAGTNGFRKSVKDIDAKLDAGIVQELATRWSANCPSWPSSWISKAL